MPNINARDLHAIAVERCPTVGLVMFTKMLETPTLRGQLELLATPEDILQLPLIDSIPR